MNPWQTLVDQAKKEGVNWGYMEKKILETYTKYQILIPSWFTTKPEYYPDNDVPHAVSKVWWYICRAMFWRYRMNYETGFLVQLNKWTYTYHFTENWQGIGINAFEGAMNKLKKIAFG